MHILIIINRNTTTMRLITTLATNDPTIVVVIHRDIEWNEYVASIVTNGKRSEDSCYRDSHRQSVESTARVMVDHVNGPVML